jgi:hypothetical protein
MGYRGCEDWKMTSSTTLKLRKAPKEAELTGTIYEELTQKARVNAQRLTKK